MPAAPSGISNVSAASGPYAAELSASSPKIGMPAAAPIFSARSSLDAMGRPKTISKRGIRVFSPKAPEKIFHGCTGSTLRHGMLTTASRVRDQIYYPFAQVPDRLMHFFSSVMSIAIRTNLDPLTIAEPLRRELRGATGDEVFYETATLEQLAVASLDRQRFLAVLFGVFAGSGLLLACIGIYGVLAYLTSQRVPEMGLRMALGASARQVVQLVLRESLAMIFAGVGVGILGALAGGRLLERVIEGMRPMDAPTLAVMISVLLLAAMIASYLPARRASRTDPMLALRQD